MVLLSKMEFNSTFCIFCMWWWSLIDYYSSAVDQCYTVHIRNMRICNTSLTSYDCPKIGCKGKRPYHFAQVSSLFCPLYICLHMHVMFKTISFQFISMGAYSMTNTSKQPTLLARMIPAFSAWPVDTDVLRRQYLLMVFDRCYYVAVHPDDWNLQWLVFKTWLNHQPCPRR